MAIRIKKKKIEFENLFFCLSMMYSSVVYLFTQTVRKVFGSTKSLDTLLIYGLMMIVVIKVLPCILRSINKIDLFLIWFLTAGFCVSLIYPNSDLGMTIAVITEILTKCIVAYFGAKLVRVTPRLFIYMRLSSIIVLLHVLSDTYIFRAEEFAKGYSQFNGYLLLYAMGLLFVAWMSAGIKADYILVTVILVFCLLMGARGPFLFCALLSVYGLYYRNKGSKHIIIGTILLLFLCIGVSFFWKDILVFLSSQLGDSASMRSINKLLEGEFLKDSLRMTHYSWSVEYIKEHIFWGCGLVNDRILINRAFPSLGEPIGCYPHNFFLEVGMQYGMVFGFVILILLAKKVFCQYYRYRNMTERILLISLIFMGFLPLMVSGSYLTWSAFYA